MSVFRFVLNLVFSNLFSLSVLTPLTLLDQLASSFLDEYSFCCVLTLAATMGSSTTLLSTMLIGLDQYLAIVDPLHYHARINKNRATALCAGVWLVSIITSLMVVFDPDTITTYFPWSTTCVPQPSLHPYSLYRLCVCVTVVLIVYCVPFLIIIVTYVRIFSAARGNSVRTRRNSISSVRRSSVTSIQGHNVLFPSPPKCSLSRSPSTRSYGEHLLTNLSTMKSRLSNASALVLYREETRAARVTVLIILLVTVCWGPYLASLILHTGHTPLSPPPWLHTLSLALLHCFSVLSPLLYSYRSRQVQKDIKKLLGIKPRLSRQEKMFKRLKSYSCPHLVLTSCQTLPGPGLSVVKMRSSHSVTDIKNRQLHLTIPAPPCTEDQWADINTSETTPCIEITPPPLDQDWGPRRLFDSGYTEERSSSMPWFSGRRRSTENQKLTLCNMDVHL